jgi:mono/diheme cytochrome c family protein
MSYPFNRVLPTILLACLCLSCAAVNASDVAAGKALYEKHCVSCHGVSGDGKGPATKAMDRNPRSFVTADLKFDTDADWQRGTDEDIANAISQGGEAFGGSPLMPAWGQQLSKEDINNLVVYIRTLEKQ